MAKNSELSPKQKRMIAALVSHRTLGAACEAVGIGRTTLTRWMTDPEFKRALLDAESEVMSDTSRSMLAGKDTALDTLHALMTEASSDGVRRQAAVDWLTFTNKNYELQNFELRLIALEEAQTKKE